ncbi:hypothetical protein [Streptomyces sp. NBC_00103]|uniref:hypothetical protein n=1 Tax=Streptomyces sp. NBC_00103 TaxID=2975653 RepID=UPI0022532B6F|nr:hypothetical protein [Streptomyces sp. NBC_00103]MCX5368287.1 hypothetical protein [Streptomyces sp. NBC_00103]
MEQRIGSSSQPLEGAGFDPAFIPGLTSPVTAEPEDKKPAEDDGVDAVEPDAGKGESAVPERPDGPAEPEASDASDGSEEPDESAESVEGPVFEASDRRARIAADAQGVRLRLDEESCEFRWDEIGAVETEAPRFGKRFTITVHTPDRRWYPIEIEATARSRFKEWEEQLDAVLDAYFEDGEAEAGADDEAVEAAGADAANAADPDAEDTGAEAAEAEDAEAEDAEVKDAEVKDAGAKAAD